MLVRSLTLLFICISIIQFTKSHRDSYDLIEKRENHKYCGSRLVAALQLVCKGVYNSMFKKSHVEYSDGDISREWFVDRNIDSVQFPFKSRISASALIPTFRRMARGVNDECCKKSCTVRELADYCGGR